MQDSPISKFNRRDFLLALSALGLAGCGSDGVESLLPGTSNGSASGSAAPVPTGAGGGIPITGTVNRAELGQKVVLSTIQRVGATPGAQGEFETLVGGSFPQLLFANESGGITNSNLRGLSIYLPNQSLQVDANSTALALVFLTLGVMTPDPVEAAARLNTIRNLPSFAPLLAFLRQGLPTQGLSALLADPQLDTLRNAVVDQFLAGLPGNAKLLTRPEYIAQGGMSIEAAEGTAGRDHRFNFENYGFRFTGVVRQEVDDEGKETRPAVLAKLVGAARLPLPSFADNTGVMGGANSLSWGTFFANSVRDPGGAVDSFTSTARSTKVRYWIRGLGGGGIPSDLPLAVRAVNLGQSDAVNTQFFYVILPLLDVVTGGGAGLAVYRLLRPAAQAAEAATEEVKGVGLILGNLAADDGTRNSIISLTSGMSGDPITDNKAFRALMVDMGVLVVGFLAATAPTAVASAIVAAAGSIAGIVGVTLAAATTVALGGWVAAGLAVVATALAITGGVAAVYNLNRYLVDLQRLPYWTKIELPLPTESRYKVIYANISPSNQDNIFADVVVNSKGSFAFASNDILPQATEAGPRQIYAKIGTGALTLIDSVADGFLVNTARAFTSAQRYMVMNENDEFAYMADQTDNGNAQVHSERIFGYKRPGRPLVKLGPLRAQLSKLLPVDADDKSLLFVQTVSDMASLDMHVPNPTPAPLQIQQLSGQTFQQVEHFDINASGLAYATGVTFNPDGPPFSIYKFVRYQYPTTTTPRLVEALARVQLGCVVSEQGDLAYILDALTLVIERKGRPQLVIPRDVSFIKWKFNDNGDLFVTDDANRLLKFSRDNSTTPEDLTQFLALDPNYPVRDFDVAGPYLGVVTSNSVRIYEELIVA